MGNEVLTLHEVADELGVHYMTVYRYVRLGLLEATKDGASWQVERDEVDRLVAERGTGTRGSAPKGSAAPRSSPPAPWASRLEARLRAGDEAGCWGVIESALASGTEPSAVHLELLAPALRGIGDGWARGELDVAVEHRATVIATRLMGRLAPRFARRGRTRGTVVLGAPPGDLHGLPVAILADLVRVAGFTAVDLGADVPAASFVHAAAGADRLVAVAIGATTRGNEPAVRSVPAVLHQALPGVTVLLGGSAVADGSHATRLGADGWAPDARSAVALIEEVATGS